jgi:hypothetical protein
LFRSRNELEKNAQNVFKPNNKVFEKHANREKGNKQLMNISLMFLVIWLEVGGAAGNGSGIVF